MKERSERFDWHETSRIHRPGQGLFDRPSGDDWIARQRLLDETARPPGLTLIPANEPLAALLTAMKLARKGMPFCMADASVASRFAREFTKRKELRESHAGQSNCNTRFHDSSMAPGFLTVSGGSTGHPKLIERTHASWIFSFERLRSLGGIREGDRVAVLGSLGYSIHAYAAFEALHLGADVLLLSGSRPDRQMLAIEKMGATAMYATPTQLRLAGRQKSVATAPSVRRIMIGGAPCDRTTADDVERQFPNAEVFEFYGSSETSFISIAKLAGGIRGPGKLFPGVEVKIGTMPGTIHDRIEAGGIWIRSPMMFTGYVNPGTGPSRAPSPDGYFFTGDIGTLGPGGTLDVVGRSDRIVRVAEKSLSLDEIEARFSTVPGICHVAAVAVPDHLRGVRLSVAVKLEPGTFLPEFADDWCRRCGPWLKPSDLHELDQWPLLASGKTDYDAIGRILSEPDR